MSDEIEIISNASRNPVERDELKFRTDIIATRCFWNEPLTGTNDIAQGPEAGQIYSVFLHQPIRFHLNMDLWLYYDPALSRFDGYETEEEVEKSRFCFGTIYSVIDQQKTGATVAFSIRETLSYRQIFARRQVIELPDFWTDFMLRSAANDELDLVKIGRYYQLNASIAQGDIGQSILFTGINGQYHICNIFVWNFDHECWFGGNFILPEVIREQIELD